jgi:hypothetical protein
VRPLLHPDPIHLQRAPRALSVAASLATSCPPSSSCRRRRRPS